MDIFASFKTVGDAIEKVRSAEDKADLVEQIDQLRRAMFIVQGEAFGLQSQLAEHQQETRELKTRIAEFENWAIEASKYRLAKMESGALVYAPIEVNEIEHQLCATCFERRIKSYLQRQAEPQLWREDDHYRAVYVCSTCKASVSFGILPIRGPQAEMEDYVQEMSNRRPYNVFDD